MCGVPRSAVASRTRQTTSRAYGVAQVPRVGAHVSQHSENTRAFRVKRAAMIKKSPWCVYCGIQVRDDVRVGHPEKATIDHIHPRGRGGAPMDERNFAVACWKCNRTKSDRILSGPDPAASRVWL